MLKKSMTLLLLVLTTLAFAEGQRPEPVELLTPEDFIMAIDIDGIVSKSSYPGAESPLNAIDEDTSTKYLNFAKINAGFIVTLDTPSAIKSFQLTTANDALERDPASWELYGTSEIISSTDNSIGTMEEWNMIDSGDLSLSDKRYKTDAVVPVNNETAYSSYKMIFPTVKDESTNCMQIGEVALFATADGSGPVVTKPSNTILAVHGGSFDSGYPGGESPAKAIDGTTDKYLNFGGVNSGLIITPAVGKTKLASFILTTANDAPERDPANWEIYGTNTPLDIEDNGTGSQKNWKLIASGTMDLPDERETSGTKIDVASKRYYMSYKMIFTGLKDESNIMQIGEIQMQGIVR